MFGASIRSCTGRDGLWKTVSEKNPGLEAAMCYFSFHWGLQ